LLTAFGFFDFSVALSCQSFNLWSSRARVL